MRVNTRSAAVAAIMALLVMSTWAMPTPAPQAKKKPAQGQQQQKPEEGQPAEQQPQQQPAAQPQPAGQPPGGGLLKGTVKASGSRQGKETASAGFNGVGPDGKVQEALLNANPTSADTAKALQLSIYSVSDSDLQAFMKDGKLAAPAQKSGGQ